MKRLLLILIVASGIAVSSEESRAQDRNQARQTVSFGVYRVDFQGWQKTVTVAPLSDDAQPSRAISLRSLVSSQFAARNEIPLAEISSKLASKKLLVTISD